MIYFNRLLIALNHIGILVLRIVNQKFKSIIWLCLQRGHSGLIVSHLYIQLSWKWECPHPRPGLFTSSSFNSRPHITQFSMLSNFTLRSLHFFTESNFDSSSADFSTSSLSYVSDNIPSLSLPTIEFNLLVLICFVN